MLLEPLLYLSGTLKRHQSVYYRKLSAIRGVGDWEGWIDFFLEAVASAALEAERGIVAIASLVAADRRRLLDAPKAGSASYRLFEALPMMPRFTVEQAARSSPPVFQLLTRLCACWSRSASSPSDWAEDASRL